MNSSRFQSMRARMTALFALLIAILMLGAGAAVQRREERRAQRRVKETLDVAIEMTGHELAEPDTAGKTFLQAVRDDQGEISAGGLALIMTDASGDILWKSRHDAPDWPITGDDWRFLTMSRGGQTLVVARDWRPVEEELHDTQVGLWLLGAVVTFGTAILAWFVVGQTLSPLEKLAAQAQNASIDSLQVRLHSPSSDAEMRHLTATLNSLLTRLEKEAQARGRFYAAASHELRTPIQVLLGEVDVIRSKERTVGEYETALAQVQHHTDRLAQLVSDLLQLNALEMKQNQAACEEINLAYWVERAISQQEGHAALREVTFQTVLEDVSIVAPPLHVEMLLRNLLENAVKYDDAGMVIEIEIKRSATCATFEIWNACALVDGAEPNSWFEPFFRPDASRSSETGGNGLGLAICRAICAANDWKIALSVENSGIRASVSFPIAAI